MSEVKPSAWAMRVAEQIAGSLFVVRNALTGMRVGPAGVAAIIDAKCPQEPIRELYTICQSELKRVTSLLATTVLERNDAKADIADLREALAHARLFIEYARYELDESTDDRSGGCSGKQFPDQADADKEMQDIEAVLARTTP